MQLRPTDLPEPVVPATSRCGIGARSRDHGVARDVLAEHDRQLSRHDPRSLVAADQFGEHHRLALRTFGSSMPITVRPGIVATRAESADMLRAISSASATTRLALMPAAGSSSYMVTTGPGRISAISALDVEIVEHAFQQPRVTLQPGACRSPVPGLGGGGGFEQIERGQHVFDRRRSSDAPACRVPRVLIAGACADDRRSAGVTDRRAAGAIGL